MGGEGGRGEVRREKGGEGGGKMGERGEVETAGEMERGPRGGGGSAIDFRKVRGRDQIGN